MRHNVLPALQGPTDSWSRLSLLIALTIYCVAGRVIWKKRHHIKGNFLNPLNENFLNTVTTTIDVSASDRRVVSMLRNDSEAQYEDYQQYTVEVETQPEDKSQLPAILHMPRITREVAENEVNPDAWLYARSAVLYFLALLLVWVQSTSTEFTTVTKLTSRIRSHQVSIVSTLSSTQSRSTSVSTTFHLWCSHSKACSMLLYSASPTRLPVATFIGTFVVECFPASIAC